ncbi:MAG TPA: hypothetical protein VGJ66_09325 [Pyrinomonadaceae bacterium]
MSLSMAEKPNSTTNSNIGNTLEKETIDLRVTSIADSMGSLSANLHNTTVTIRK